MCSLIGEWEFAHTDIVVICNFSPGFILLATQRSSMRFNLRSVFATLALVTVLLVGYFLHASVRLVEKRQFKGQAEWTESETGTSSLTNLKATTEQATKKKPVILLWIPPYAQIKWFLPDTPICGGGCVITEDRDKYDESDAVVFFMKGTNRKSIPNPRKHSRKGKVYVWWCEESPWTVRHYYGHLLREFNGYYNWTMHYKSHSDVLATLIPHTARDWLLRRIGRESEAFNKTVPPGFTHEEFESAYASLRKEKTKSAIMVASDCTYTKGAIDRWPFAKKLAKVYNLEIFGSCNEKPLPMSNSVFQKILRSYKFFMAFENTKGCSGYVTEKFWINSLYVGCVPVVWGSKKADVARLAPPNSFIHVEDFGYNVNRLAKYLEKVEANETLYKSFFNWWKDPGFYPLMKFREPSDPRDAVSDEPLGYQVSAHCHLCKKLNDGEHLNTSKVVRNLAQDFFAGEKAECYL